jgi:hypothetical protein
MARSICDLGNSKLWLGPTITLLTTTAPLGEMEAVV